MDRLGAPDQGAIQGVRGPSRWAGPEINLTGSSSTSGVLVAGDGEEEEENRERRGDEDREQESDVCNFLSESHV